MWVFSAEVHVAKLYLPFPTEGWGTSYLLNVDSYCQLAVTITYYQIWYHHSSYLISAQTARGQVWWKGRTFCRCKIDIPVHTNSMHREMLKQRVCKYVCIFCTYTVGVTFWNVKNHASYQAEAKYS